jgi:UDP-N-acetylmuramoylalanine--D-glutamate ligase
MSGRPPRAGPAPLEVPRRVLVVGLARSGQAGALALARRGVDVIASDRAEVDAGRLAAAGVELRLGTEEEALLQGVELVVKSPGVPGTSPLVAGARRRGVPVWSEVELGYQLLGEPPLVAVTGTNGKTTTTGLLGAIFRAAGRPVEVAGNIGRPLTALDELDDGAWVVCEVSSFQLEDVHEFHPRIAVLLNLEPDHLDRHESFEAYRDAKLRVFENQEPDDTAVAPRGFGPFPGRARRLEFDRTDPLPAEPAIPGAHNRENAAAATAAARAAGIGDEAIADALRTFPGVPHRLELVRERDGVRYVNDSKATNVAAARVGVAAFDAPLRLILGGSRKGEAFTGLADDLRGRTVTAYVIGETADEIRAALEPAGIPLRRCDDLPEAVRAAARDARPGEVVLLSPACASYDQFRDFEQRGDLFRRLVKELP